MLTRRVFTCSLVGAGAHVCMTKTVKADEGCDLIIRIEGLRNSRGNVVLGLWDSPKGFPKDTSKAIRKTTIRLTTTTATTTLTALKAGEYALAAFHDENVDGKLDTRFPGIPVEGICSSNNPHLRFSAPSFAQCRFIVLQIHTVVELRMIYQS